MDEALRVQIAESVKHGAEHVAGFGGSEGALRENLREIFFGIFHDDVEKVHVRETAAAALVQLKQIGMREFGGAAPERELQIGGYALGNELDDGFGRLRAGELREENGGFAGTA